jgi:2-oxoglutarate ferredoxin oxidoreductase subunit gamma
MSQGGYDKHASTIKENGTLLIDQDLVQPRGLKDGDYFAIPATRIAEEIGRKMMANIVMLGFFTAVTDAVTLEAAQNAVASSVPKGTEKMNIAAFSKGYDCGMATLKGRRKKAAGKKGAGS